MGPTKEIDPVKYGAMWQQVQDMDKRLQNIESNMAQLLELANRSKGGMWLGLALLGGLGTLLGILVSIYNLVKAHWH